MKRILVPVDFSTYSDNAFRTAVRIADRTDSSITCVNVVTSSLDWDRLNDVQKEKHSTILDLEAEATDKLKTFVLNHKTSGVPVDQVVRVGLPDRVILEIANSQKADLIVIGAYGRGHTSDKFVGSNLQKILRNADCPVLAVKKAMSGLDLRKMAFAAMFNEDSKPSFVKMKPLIKAFQTSVHFLYVNTPSKFVGSSAAQHKMDAYAKGFEDIVIHKNVYNHNTSENGIVEFAEAKKIGFIGIASSNRKGKSTYQIGVTDTVLFKSDIPVLSVKAEEG